MNPDNTSTANDPSPEEKSPNDQTDNKYTHTIIAMLTPQAN